MSYERLERWLAAHRPAILANLLPPADDAELARLEATIGASLPPSFLDLYRWRNGQRDLGRGGAFYGLAFLSIPDVIAQWETWNDVILDMPEDDMRSLDESQSSVVLGVVKERYANRLWIPFVHDWGGNHIGVDLDPGPNGRVGQVINFGRDEEAKFVLGQTVDDFIDRIATELEAGNFVLDEEDDGIQHEESADGAFPGFSARMVRRGVNGSAVGCGEKRASSSARRTASAPWTAWSPTSISRAPPCLCW